MVEQTSHFEPLDRGRVDLTDPNEAQYWCQEFGCTEVELQEAIARVGAHTGAVREELHRTGHRKP